MATPEVLPPEVPPPLAGKMLTGTAWMLAMRWLMRLLAVANVVVLARLLEKDDFGLAAMASAVLALPILLLELGMEQAIIRERRPARGMYDTAWTIRLLQMSLVAMALYLTAPLAAGFYDDLRMVEIMQVLAVAVFIRGLENFWTVSFRKQMNFRRDFTYEVLCKLSGVIATIVLAFVLRSYWALIYGQIAAHGFRLLLSMVLAPSLPRPTLSHWRQIWSFSQWSLLRGFATYIIAHADKLILGRLSTPAAVGGYSLAREIAELPISDISGPANRTLGPGFAELQSDRRRLSLALAKAVSAVATITVPIGVGLALTAYEVVAVMLGENWLSAVPMLQILALSSLLASIRGITGNTLVVIGHIRLSTMITWARALTFVALAIPMTLRLAEIGMALAFAASESVTFGVTVFYFRRILPDFTFRMLLTALMRPILSAAAMAPLVLLVTNSGVAPAPVLLFCQAATGGVAYVAALLLLWLMAGRPDGIEQAVVERLAAIRKSA